jgi:hypothetical protein
MKCEETAEFVSSLVDGERIPRAAAEHIGQCETCKTRLMEYAEMGAELRREASLAFLEPSLVGSWKTGNQIKSNLWTKGWQTMRIPRFAFALLVVAIVGLTSGLIVVRVRAQTQGAVLMLNVKTADNKSVLCPLLIQSEHSAPCIFVQSAQSGLLVSGYRISAIDGGRVQLGVRTIFKPFVKGVLATVGSTSDIDGLPETEYSFQPGETLKVEGEGSIPITITGQYTDHLPTIAGENSIDPEPDIMRIVSPILLRNKKEVFDFEGFVNTNVEKGWGVDIYTPETGRYVLALSPMPGAVEGKLQQSRISFNVNGDSYVFLMAIPVARADKVWILHEPEFRPSQASPGARDDQSFAGSIALNHLHDRAPLTN